MLCTQHATHYRIVYLCVIKHANNSDNYPIRESNFYPSTEETHFILHRQNLV